MAQSDARFGFRAKLNRESHNLSRKFGFTCPPGMLLPIFADVATPGDAYYIQHDLTYLRTLPLLAPAMVDVKVHFESFFVPFQMIYEPIENTVFSLNNLRSSLYNIAIGDVGELQNNNFPLFDYYNQAKDFRETSTLQESEIRFNAFRLADMLGLNPLAITGDAQSTGLYDYAPNFFPWQLLAYQTIWQYFYRLDDKSQFNNTFCNWDIHFGDSLVTRQPELFRIHNRAWDFDYYTSMYRSPIVSDANMQHILNAGDYSDFFVGQTRGQNENGVSAPTNSDIRSFMQSIPSSPTQYNLMTAVNTAAIRQMFANEKLAMITGRARKTYDSQVLAHFGVSVPKDVKHDISLIGADTYNLNVGEVTSLASTYDSSTRDGAGLGDLAGKGWSSGQGRKHKFTAPTHGVIMTIFSVEPTKRYFGGFDRKNAVVSCFNFPCPEFDRLGNQPMFKYEAGYSSTSEYTKIIGWKERYYEWKREHDKVTFAYQTVPANQVRQGLYNDKRSYMLATNPFGVNEDFQTRPDLEETFYIDNNAVSNLVPISYVSNWMITDDENWNNTPWLAYSRDPFIVDSYLKVTKVSWMSKDGEPIYNF